ncbi:MAG: amino acid adenylation domain-containing protein, partial [Deltaproteobacteria bacterium]
MPFERVVEAVQPPRDTSRSPLFQTMFAFQNTPGGEAVQFGNAELATIDQDFGIAKFELTLTMWETPRGLAGAFEYNTDLFDRETVERLAGHFGTLLAELLADPETRPGTAPLLTAPEHAQIAAWNATGREYATDTVHALIEQQARRTPDAIAVEDESRAVTYAALDRESNQLAHWLRERGVGRETLVGVCLERSVEMVVSLLAVLKAGAGYVPIDPTYPADRLRFMFEDSGVVLVLTQGSVLEGVKSAGAMALAVDLERAALSRRPATSVGAPVDADDLAYVIYTSGSTGRPKGAGNAHRGVANQIHAMQTLFALHTDDVVLQKTPFTFDVSVWELFWTLTTGARLVMARPEGHRDPAYIMDVIAERSVTTLTFVPSMLAVFLAEPLRGSTASVRRVLAAGEALSTDVAERFFARFVGAQLHNLYGPTEAAVTVTHWKCERGSARASVPIGRPMPNTHVHVLDARMHPVPLGVSGELYLGGVQLARGYHGRAELTAERFVPDPAGSGERLYRTGDLARWLPDGTVDYLGRVDFQVKVRGFRIELGEIETALLQTGWARECVVTAREDASGDRSLVAYLVATDGRTHGTSELREALKKTLPEYMVPSAFVWLEAMPLNSSGKTDRKALPAPEHGLSDAEGEFVAPRDATERAVADAFAAVLRRPVSVHQSFFDAGGNSLIATQLASRVRAALSVDLPLRAVFQSPTIAGIAEYVRGAPVDDGDEPPVEITADRTRGPVSFPQQRLWFLDQLEPGSAAYNIPAALRITRHLDADALERTLGEIVRRHDALRTTFASADGEPVQIVHAPGAFRLARVQLAMPEGSARQAETVRLTREEAAKPFDLSSGPLFRATLVTVSPDEWLLLVTMHHIVSDGWSMGVLVREAAEIYSTLVRGEAPSTADLAYQYLDYAHWQRRDLTAERAAKQLDYWKARLAGAPSAIELPTDRARPAVKSFHGAQAPVALDAALVAGLARLSRDEGATSFMVLLAAYASLLARYSGQTDLVIGTPVANRTRAQFEPLIGFFVNTLAVRVDLSGEPTFRALVRRVKDGVLGDLAHQAIPFDRVVDAVQPPRDTARTPLFQTMFTFQNTPAEAVRFGDAELASADQDFGIAKFELTLTMWETPRGLAGAFEYNTDLFDRETVERLAGHFGTLLAELLADPETRPGTAPLLTAPEHAQIAAWNATGREYATDTVHALIEQQARRTPDAIAVEDESRAVTYAALDRESNQLAHWLRERGVGRETLVGVCLERSVEMVVSLLAVLKAGAGYVPIDPTYPADRLRFMFEDSGVVLVLTQGSVLEGVKSAGAMALAVDLERAALSRRPATSVGAPVDADDLAYVIYTSGSTGRPKGAGNAHRGVANQIHAMQTLFALHTDDVVLQKTPFTFDVSVWELFWTLTTGARLVMARPEGHRDPAYIMDVIAERSVTTLTFVPSMLAVFLAEPLRGSTASVRRVLAAGEALSTDVAERFFARFVGAQLHNLYGPTEAAVTVTHWKCERGSARASVPIGRPMPNTHVHVLDARMHPVPLGVSGELYLGGVQLARGYHGRAELTAERFVPDPAGSGERLYRTGDLARWLPDGTVDYLGRVDFQVKVRGFRIELGEIETALLQTGWARECVVTAREDASGDRSLVAYLVATDGRTHGTSELREALKKTLPEYMVPSAFVWLEAMPLNSSGKTDRKALPAPEHGLSDAEGEFVAPRDAIEEAVAEAFAAVLRRPVSIHQSFFDAGGNSLVATQLASRLRTALSVDLPLRTVFQSP